MKKVYLLLIGIISFLMLQKPTLADNNYITLNQENTTIGINYSITLKVIAVGNIETKNIIWTSSDSSIVVVNNGVVTGKRTGTATITAKVNNYKATCKVQVINDFIPITKITTKDSSGTILINQTIKITPTISPTNATNQKLQYSTSDSNIAVIDQNGNVTGKKVGTTYITISSLTSNAKATYILTVTDKISLKNISIKESIEIKEKSSTKLNISFNPSNATNKNVTWKSSNEKIATVDQNGNVTGISPGTTTIQAISKDGGHVDNCKVTVTAISKKLIGIKLNKETLTLTAGEEETLTITYNPSYAENKNVTWKSSNEELATVKDGKITAIKPGNVEITATSEDGNFKTICNLTILSLPIKSIKFEREEQNVYLGSTITLKTISEPIDSSLNNPIWTSSDNNIATVNAGILETISIGTTYITLSNEDGTIKATTKINVIPQPPEPLSIEVEGYDLKFNEQTKNYNLKIGNEKTLNFKINIDSNKVIINGNKELKNGSIITITINDDEKVTYVINIKKKQNYTIYFISIISFLLLLNIIRMLVRNKKKK